MNKGSSTISAKGSSTISAKGYSTISAKGYSTISAKGSSTISAKGSSTVEPTARLMDLMQYSFLALPLAFAGLPLYIHGPDFYARELGLSLGLIGSILLFIRLFDAFQDPFIGYITDKYHQRRFRIISTGITLLIIGMAAVFYGPQWGVGLALWFTASMVLATTGFSIVTINVNMMGGLWYQDHQERTRISAWRESFALLGLLIASILPAVLQSVLPVEISFIALFWVFTVILLFAFAFFSRFTLYTFKENQSTEKTIRSTKKLAFLRILIGPDRHFFGVCFLSHLSSAIPGVLVLFFIYDYLGAGRLAGLFLFFYFLSGATLIFLWVKLAKKMDKTVAWLASMLLAVATFIWAYFLQPGDTLAYGIICILSGMALGADLSLPPSILADRINRNKDEMKATQYYALLAFIPKTAIAIASGVSLLILDTAGFVTGGQNSPAILHQLILLYALAPCLIKIIAALYLWRLHKVEGEFNESNLKPKKKASKRNCRYGSTHAS